jgi:hypothetical protein
MIGIPWFLGALGIFLVLIGFILAGLSPGSRSAPPRIDSKMRDEDIARHLRDEERIRITFPILVIFAGLVCVVLGFIGRVVVRFFL